MTFGSALLAAIPGIRHAFFTREGGVSGEIYESLNGGLGSNDDPANVLENRRRMAEQMGVMPENFISVHQIHSPDAVAATGPWPDDTRPRADAIVTAPKASPSASPPPIAGRSCSPTPAPA